MSKLCEYAIKSYLTNLTCVECHETFFNTKGSFTFGAPKHGLLPSVVFVTHYTPLCWPGFFFLSVVFFLENVFQQVAAHFCLRNDGLEISWHFNFQVQ